MRMDRERAEAARAAGEQLAERAKAYALKLCPNYRDKIFCSSRVETARKRFGLQFIRQDTVVLTVRFSEVDEGTREGLGKAVLEQVRASLRERFLAGLNVTIQWRFKQ